MPFGVLKGPPWRIQGEVAGESADRRRYSSGGATIIRLPGVHAYVFGFRSGSQA